MITPFNNNIIDMVSIFVYKLYHRFINTLFINMHDTIASIGDKCRLPEVDD